MGDVAEVVEHAEGDLLDHELLALKMKEVIAVDVGDEGQAVLSEVLGGPRHIGNGPISIHSHFNQQVF